MDRVEDLRRRPRQVGAGSVCDLGGVPLDDAEHVVEVVGYAARQLSDGFEPLCLEQLCVAAPLVVRVANGPRQRAPSQLPLHQVVLRPVLQRCDADLIVVEAREDHERHVRRERFEPVDGAEALALGKAEVGQNDVVAAVREVDLRLCQRAGVRNIEEAGAPRSDSMKR